MRMSSSRSLLLSSRRTRWRTKGRTAHLWWPSEVALLNARVDPRTAARVGSTLRLVVDPARFHFFDPETGLSLLDSDAVLWY